MIRVQKSSITIADKQLRVNVHIFSAKHQNVVFWVLFLRRLVKNDGIHRIGDRCNGPQKDVGRERREVTLDSSDKIAKCRVIFTKQARWHPRKYRLQKKKVVRGMAAKSAEGTKWVLTNLPEDWSNRFRELWLHWRWVRFRNLSMT